MLTTLPNLLTLSRIVAIPLVIITFYVPAPEGPWIGCVLFALAAFTDWLDGHLARLWQQQSELGRFLDPIADKLLVAAALFMLGALHAQRRARHAVLRSSILPALVILSREILVSGLREYLAGLARAPAGVAPRQMEDRHPDGRDRRAAGRRCRPARAAGAVSSASCCCGSPAVLTIVTGYDYLRAGLSHINDETPSAAKPSSVA